MSLFPKPSSLTEYHETDGLRGIAILLVFGIHYQRMYLTAIIPSDNPLFALIYSGAYGVQLFFVLSAYLLFRAQYQRLMNAQTPTPATHFFLRRFLRIAPLFYVCLLAYCYGFEPSFLRVEKFHHVLAHLLFVHNFFPEIEYSILSASWSLGIELLFYISLMVIVKILLLLRSDKQRTTLWRYSLVALLLIGVVINYSADPISVPKAAPFSFLCGLAVAVITTHLATVKYAKQWLIVPGIVAITAIAYLHWHMAQVSYADFDVAFRASIPAISLAYALLILVASQQDRLIYPVLAWLPLRVIGLFSYEIYLIHLVAIIFAPEKLLWFAKLQQSHPLMAIVSLFLSVFLISGLLHFLISRPCITLAAYLTRRQEEKPALLVSKAVLILTAIITLSPLVYFVYQRTHPIYTLIQPTFFDASIVHQQRLLKTGYEASTEVYLDGLVADSFFKPLAGTALQWQNQQLAIHAQNDDPGITTTVVFSLQPQHFYILKVVLESPQATKFQLFYASYAEPLFTEQRSISLSIHPGHNEIFIPLQMQDDTLKQLRVDPAFHAGAYVMTEFKIKHLVN